MKSRLRALASWQVAGPILGYAIVAVIVALVLDSFIARREANQALRDQTQQAIDARHAATRRIDLLQQQIDLLQRRLVGASRERGRLEDAIKALAEQIRQEGGVPVTTGRPQRRSDPQPSPSPTNRSTPRPTPRPSPTATATATHSPTPSPSPTKICVLIICLR